VTSISPLNNVLKKGLYGNNEEKSEDKLIKIKEIKNLLIVQIAQYKNSSVKINDLDINKLKFPSNSLNVSVNTDCRILWSGPSNWLLVSQNKNLLSSLKNSLNEKDFAITDLSHSRAIIELGGPNSKEILKKGCPFNFNELKKNNCVNSVFNGIAVTIDMLNDDPCNLRLFVLRSFGESFFHSVFDSCLEDGFKII